MLLISESKQLIGIDITYCNESGGEGGRSIGSAMIETHYYCQGGESKRRALPILWSVLIEREYRNRGEGSRMIGEILAHCRQGGIERLALRVYTNNHRAIAVYAKHGFIQDRSHCGDCDRSIGGGDLDCDLGCDELTMITAMSEGEQREIEREQAAALAAASGGERRDRCGGCGDLLYGGEDCRHCDYCRHCLGYICEQCGCDCESGGGDFITSPGDKCLFCGRGYESERELILAKMKHKRGI